MSLSHPFQHNSPSHRLNPWLAGLALAGIALTTAACGTTATKSASPSPTTTKKQHSTAPKLIRQKGSNTLLEGAAPWAGAANLKHYVALAKAKPHSVNALYNAAVSEFVNGNITQSITYYKSAIDYDPTNGTLWNNLANIYNYHMKEPNVALPDYEKAVHYGPSNPINWSNLINCEVSLKNTATAKADAEQALKVLPKEPSNLYYKNVVADLKAFNKPATTKSTAASSASTSHS